MGLRNGTWIIKSADFLLHFGNHFRMTLIRRGAARLKPRETEFSQRILGLKLKHFSNFDQDMKENADFYAFTLHQILVKAFWQCSNQRRTDKQNLRVLGTLKKMPLCNRKLKILSVTEDDWDFLVSLKSLVYSVSIVSLEMHNWRSNVINEIWLILNYSKVVWDIFLKFLAFVYHMFVLILWKNICHCSIGLPATAHFCPNFGEL